MCCRLWIHHPTTPNALRGGESMHDVPLALGVLSHHHATRCAPNRRANPGVNHPVHSLPPSGHIHTSVSKVARILIWVSTSLPSTHANDARQPRNTRIDILWRVDVQPRAHSPARCGHSPDTRGGVWRLCMAPVHTADSMPPLVQPSPAPPQGGNTASVHPRHTHPPAQVPMHPGGSARRAHQKTGQQHPRSSAHGVAAAC